MKDISPLRVLRLKSRNKKPGLVQIECPTRDDKVRVLRQKGELKDTNSYNRVYLRTSMSHTDRVMQHNFQQILKEIPNVHQFRVSGNGKIIPRDDGQGDRDRDSDVNTAVDDRQEEDRNRERLFREVIPLRDRGRGRGHVRR